MKVLSPQELAIASSTSREGDPKGSMALAEHKLAQGLRNEARDFYIIAAIQGSSSAANAAAVLFAEEGANDDAIKWLKVACQAGNKLACTHLSLAYLGGSLGLEPNIEKAAKYGRLGDLELPEREPYD